MAATTFFAIYPAATTPTWSRGVGSYDGWSGTPTAYGQDTSPPTGSATDDEPTITWTGTLAQYTEYKLWAIWDDGANTSNSGVPLGSSAWTSAGTLYVVVYPSAESAPNATEVKLGQKSGGGAATYANSISSPTATTTNNWPAEATGLTTGSTYRHALVWSDGTNDSAVAVSDPWTAAYGTLYWIVQPDATATPTQAQVKDGLDGTGAAALRSGSVPYTGAGTFDAAAAITGLTAGTPYELVWTWWDGTNYNPDGVETATITTDSAGTSVSPTAGAITVTGYAPTLEQPQSAAPTAGAITVTGYAPDVQQTAGATVSPGAGSVTLTGYAPTLEQPQSAAPTAGALTLTGYAPDVQQSAAGNVQPGAGALAITGYAPTLTQPQSAAPTAGAITVTGYAPEVLQGARVDLVTGALAFTGHAPTIEQTTSISVSPSAGQIIVTGYAPTVVRTGTFAWTEVDTTQVAGWGEVSTSQAAGWIPVNTQ